MPDPKFAKPWYGGGARVSTGTQILTRVQGCPQQWGLIGIYK